MQIVAVKSIVSCYPDSHCQSEIPTLLLHTPKLIYFSVCFYDTNQPRYEYSNTKSVHHRQSRIRWHFRQSTYYDLFEIMVKFMTQDAGGQITTALPGPGQGWKAATATTTVMPHGTWWNRPSVPWRLAKAKTSSLSYGQGKWFSMLCLKQVLNIDNQSLIVGTLRRTKSFTRIGQYRCESP